MFIIVLVAYFYASQLQHLSSFSVSLNIGIPVLTTLAPLLQLQHSTFGLQVGFSHTNSHFGLGHYGLTHFQSHFGSSQIASHSGLGT